MKLLKQAVFLALILVLQLQGQNKYIESITDFSIGEKAYLFGDNVKLRAAPNTSSNVITLLKIATEVKILEKSTNTQLYNGKEWAWYKISSNATIGYVLGGLIALDKKTINNSTYLVSIKKVAVDETYEKTYAITRVINQNKDGYLENISMLDTNVFSLEVYDNKGLDSIENMAYISYMAESCGVNGGGYYLFNDEKSLNKAIDVSSIGDGGVYWLSEKVIFPNDIKGKKGKILFKSEEGEVVDEETQHEKIKIESIEFVWEGKLLNIKTDKSRI